MKTVSRYPWYRAMVWAGCATVVVAGCASMPAPTTQFDISKAAVAGAVNAGAPELAPLEMKTARDKLDRANLALIANDNEQARVLAEQAEVDAKLAEVKAHSVKAQKAAAVSNEDTRVLREELDRQTNQSK